MATLAGAEREISRLLEENRNVGEQLKQCQADKDFVWSLWKKLQVTNPDVTEAIGLVVQREREKAEVRDRKVLEILQRKDEKIEELTNNLLYKTQELGQSTIRHANGQDEVTTLQRQVDALQDRNATLEMQIRNTESREKNLETIHSDVIQENEKEKRDLLHKVQMLTSDLEKSRSAKAEEMAQRVHMESKVRIMDQEVEQKIGKFEQLLKELEESRSLLRKFESQMRQQAQDLDYKNSELETVRKELAELWTTHNQLTEHSSQQADLIRQIQYLQSDTQKMMKNQEEAYNMESNSLQSMYTDLTSRYDSAKKTETELRSQVLALKKGLLDKDDVIAELQTKVSRRSRGSVGRDNSGSFLEDVPIEQVEPVLDLEYKVKSMHKEIDYLRKQLALKEGKIDELQEDAINQTIEFDVARLNRHERTHSTPAREFRSVGLSPLKPAAQEGVKGSRSRSMSPTRREQPRSRLHVQKELEDCRATLKLKVRELNELKKAHAKRQERLKTVQENYRNVKEQLKTLEAEYYGSKKKPKKVKRVDPKELRHEDSHGVWNELAYFKNENRNMVVDRMGMEEELDGLRVQASQDAATIHELRLSLEQEREERLFDKKKKDREGDNTATLRSEIVLLKSEVQNKDVTLERLDRDLRDVRGDKEALFEEKRLLKTELMDLKKEASQHRMDQADLKRTIQRLRRELEEEKSINKLQSKESKSPATKTVYVKIRPRKKKSRNVNTSTSSIHKKFDELIEEGWEEMSEASDEEGSDTLGEKIVERSQQGDNSSQDSSSDHHVYRVRRSVQMKQSGRTKAGNHRPVAEVPPPPRNTEARACRALMRDMATSPGSPTIQESPATKKAPSPAHLSAVRQLKPIKQRVGYLQQQVVTLRDSRSSALKTIEELKETTNQLQADLNLANQRLRVSKQTIQGLIGWKKQRIGNHQSFAVASTGWSGSSIEKKKELERLSIQWIGQHQQDNTYQQQQPQIRKTPKRKPKTKSSRDKRKLNNDLDKVHIDKKEMEVKLTEKLESGTTDTPGRSDHDWRVQESRLKSCTNELTRQNAAVRQLKQENETQVDQIRLLQDKVSRAERDSNQKRTLLEDQRSRVKMALESAKADADSLEQLETKTKLLQDTNEKQKIQLESFKKRLAAVTREKREYEERFLKLTSELERKNKLLLDSQEKKMELEVSLGEMEKLATRQMKCLARESEDALETAKVKLREIQQILQAYQRFVKNLAHEIVRRTQHTRASVWELETRKSSQDRSNVSLQRAQNLAKDILNLSQSDLDDIMSADGDTNKLEAELELERRKDKKWAKRVEKTQNSKDDFAMSLMDLFLQKIEERSEMMARLQTVKQQSQSEISGQAS